MEDLEERQSQNTIWAKIAKIQFPTTQLNEETLKDLMTSWALLSLTAKHSDKESYKQIRYMWNVSLEILKVLKYNR